MMCSPEGVEHAPVGGPVDGLQPLVEILRFFVPQLSGVVYADTTEVLGDGWPDTRERLEAVQSDLLHHDPGTPLDIGHLSAQLNRQASDDSDEMGACR